MIATGTKRTRWTAPLAAVLLVIQGIAGGVVPLAHAAERLTAPTHIEAQHSSGCVALHDALRCVLCHYASSRVVTQQVRTQSAATTTVESRREQADGVQAASPDHLAPPPRAPPAPRV